MSLGNVVAVVKKRNWLRFNNTPCIAEQGISERFAGKILQVTGIHPENWGDEFGSSFTMPAAFPCGCVRDVLLGDRPLSAIRHDHDSSLFVVHVHSPASVIDLDQGLGAVAQAAALGEHGVLAKRGDEALQIKTGGAGLFARDP